MLGYQKIITRLAQELGLSTDPRQIEAYMRLNYRTLDGLSPAAFKKEVFWCAKAAENDPVAAEGLAKSFGL